jgi:transcriptional regulator with XRE-family HTH domain
MLPTTMVRGRPNPRHEKFAERLRRVRLAVGMTAAGLDAEAGLGGGVVSRLERGQGLPTLPTASWLALALGLSTAWLAYGIGDPAPGEENIAGLAGRAQESRTFLGLSQRELAKRAGVAHGAVRSVECGGMPGIDTLEKIAGAMGVSPSWLGFGLGDRELPRRGKQLEATAARSVTEEASVR